VLQEIKINFILDPKEYNSTAHVWELRSISMMLRS
jgi:hypothetical protein